MENELRIIAELEPEQVVERAKALLLDVEYWQHVLDDAAKVNDAVLDATLAVIEASSSTLALMPLMPTDRTPIVESIIWQLRVTLNALVEVTNAVDRTLELADGRRKALEPIAAAIRRAAGLDTDDADEPGA